MPVCSTDGGNTTPESYRRRWPMDGKTRTIKKTGLSTTESRYYLSSAMPREYTPQPWLELIRGPWGGVEIRNHWRRDALMGEDRSRSRNASLLANLALIRNALLLVMSDRLEKESLPQLREAAVPVPPVGSPSSHRHEFKTKDPGCVMRE